jgi:hypothetical protein
LNNGGGFLIGDGDFGEQVVVLPIWIIRIIIEEEEEAQKNQWLFDVV